MENKTRKYFFWIALIIVQAVWIFNSDGFYFIDDSSHFNYNRHFFDSFSQSTGAWHRMGRVLLFAIPAQFGLKGVQIVSALIFLLTIYFSYRILKEKNIPYAEWVIPVLGFQPVLFNISFTSLAELPAAFLIVLSFYYYLKDKPKLALITSSLIFIFRTEYSFVCAIYFLIYAYRKNYSVLLLAITGPVLWYLYTTIITLNPTQFFYDMTLHSRLLKIDVGVDWYYYLLHSPKIFGFIQAAFFIAGAVILFYKKELKDYWILVLIFFGGIAVQTLLALKGLNLTCSIGQLRYVAVVGPAFGIVAAAGIGYFYDRFKNPAGSTILSAVLLFIMFLLGPYSVPYHNKFEIEKVSEDITAFAQENYPGYKIITNMHQIANALDESQTGGKKFTLLSQTNLNNTPKALIVWCSYLEGSPFVDDDVTLKEIESIAGIKQVKDYKDTVNNCLSIPVYRHHQDGDEYSISRDFIDYMIADQTTWENIDIRVFLKP
ncbi:MAG TPA: hypothetical protein PKE39_01965 [Ignavibacteria bacterium]|nr:hypothetical protein [Ignavibacteria bacterium]HMQ97765.1 hypothetical protein [Ignavibacteria bacterium]